jgi:hypothetical protein
MKSLSKTIISAAAVLAALTSISWAAWQLGEYTELRPAIYKELHLVMDKVEQSQQTLLLIRYQILDAKLNQGGLTVSESIERCQIAKILEYPLTIVGCQ